MIATTEYSAARYNMVESQLRPNKVTDHRLVDAFLAVPRDQFVPGALRGVAYVDKAIPVGNGRFLLEPMVLGRMLQEARITAGDLVLDIGTATGYSAAIIGHVAATVVAVESDAALAAQADQAMQTLGVDNAAVVQGDLAAGWAKQGPYDVIVIEGAVAAVPQALLDQLAEGGRLVTVLLPESGVSVARLYQKVGGLISSRTLFDATASLLPGMEPKAGFSF
jgi:protein-L-isoaspartate(D-aspartate) O-methyltransferase